tara:strand:+ start:686 stop:1075 length:390 start_codon:yes stop_codon:yes gene_type:complete
MDTEEKPKRGRGRPRKSPETNTQVKKPRGRPRKKTVEPPKQELNDEQVLLLLTNYLKGVEGIKIDWDSVRKIHPNKYIYQVIVDKLSTKFLSQLQDIPLVKDVFFFSKVGSGVNGINLLFKVHIVFDTL